MPLKLLSADITRLEVDAIVNAANTQLAAGAACDKLAPIQTGEAVITPGFNLPAKFIIHTAGPIWRGGRFGEENLLRSCYTNSLKLAAENNLKSVAFPLISSGIYGYPPFDALKVAVKAIKDFLKQKDLEVVLTVLDKSLLDSAARTL